MEYMVQLQGFVIPFVRGARFSVCDILWGCFVDDPLTAQRQQQGF
jgi:hypothetical protein